MSGNDYFYDTPRTIIVHEVPYGVETLGDARAENIATQLRGTRVGLIAAALLAGIAFVTSFLGICVLVVVNKDAAELPIVAARCLVAGFPGLLALLLLVGLITTLIAVIQQLERPTVAGFADCLRYQMRLWQVMAIVAFLGSIWVLALPWAFRWLS